MIARFLTIVTVGIALVIAGVTFSEGQPLLGLVFVGVAVSGTVLVLGKPKK